MRRAMRVKTSGNWSVNRKRNAGVDLVEQLPW